MFFYVAGGKNEIAPVDLEVAYELYFKLESFGMSVKRHKGSLQYIIH